MDQPIAFHLAILSRLKSRPHGDAPTLDVAMMNDNGLATSMRGALVLRIAYASAEAHAARVSADVEELATLDGFVCVESWTDPATPLVVFLRYEAAGVTPTPVSILAPDPYAPATYERETDARERAAAPPAVAPKPIAPVPASPHRRR